MVVAVAYGVRACFFFAQASDVGVDCGQATACLVEVTVDLCDAVVVGAWRIRCLARRDSLDRCVELRKRVTPLS